MTDYMVETVPHTYRHIIVDRLPKSAATACGTGLSAKYLRGDDAPLCPRCKEVEQQ